MASEYDFITPHDSADGDVWDGDAIDIDDTIAILNAFCVWCCVGVCVYV